MLAVTSPGFLVFAALFAGAWYKSRPANRWRWMLAAGILFYLSLDWQGFVVLLASSLLVWACAFRAKNSTPRLRLPRTTTRQSSTSRMLPKTRSSPLSC